MHLPIGFATVEATFRLTSGTRVGSIGWACEIAPLLNPAIAADDIFDAVTVGSEVLFNPARYTAQYTFLGITVTKATVDGPLAATRAAAQAGQTAGDSLPPNTAFLVRKRTALGGRQNQGRMYLPPAWITEASVAASGTLSGNTYNDLRFWVNTTFAALGTAGYPPFLLHNNPSVEPTPCTEWLLDNRVATQRRRLR